ncbi:hypothetical protein AA3271_2842 [Gluconobacter japonicus NBRC 3271]|nr:hypothetical protein AA3271_2842 [Gluconobacter japonicus NBRC 3271]
MGDYFVSIPWQRTADNPWMRQIMSDAFLAILLDLEAMYSGGGFEKPSGFWALCVIPFLMWRVGG